MNINFGLQLPSWAGFSIEECLEQALLAEKAGFNYICVPDHFFLTEGIYRLFKATYDKCDPTRRDMFDPWVILSAVAVITNKVMLGTGVSPISYYNPARLAKIIASIDHVSHGRFILGAGAGWHREEADCYKVPWGSFSVRFRMMNEGIELMKKLWTTDAKVTWKGRYYEVDNAPAWPKPVQVPHPPIWYGGSGSKIVEVTGKLGDGWCPYITLRITPKLYREKWSMIRSFAEEVGRDPEKIVPSAHVIMSMEKDHDRAFQKYEDSMMVRMNRKLTDDEVKHSIFGTPDDCIDKFEKYVEAGVRHFVVNPYPHPDDVREFFEAFKKTVIPQLNA